MKTDLLVIFCLVVVFNKRLEKYIFVKRNNRIFTVEG